MELRFGEQRLVAVLDLDLDGGRHLAREGRERELAGSFDRPGSPLPVERRISLYLHFLDVIGALVCRNVLTAHLDGGARQRGRSFALGFGARELRRRPRRRGGFRRRGRLLEGFLRRRLFVVGERLFGGSKKVPILDADVKGELVGELALCRGIDLHEDRTAIEHPRLGHRSRPSRSDLLQEAHDRRRGTGRPFQNERPEIDVPPLAQPHALDVLAMYSRPA
ncbi:MAG: hypothetical protein KF819_23870 [Labilithrix sp.]|nr:hypothetical protein [Labilithrix sp.]